MIVTLCVPISLAFSCYILDKHGVHFVQYHYSANAIFTEPMMNTFNKEVLRVYNIMYTYLAEPEFKVILNIMHNQVSKIFK